MLREVVTLYLQRQILEANFEGIPLRHYLQATWHFSSTEQHLARGRLRASLFHISDLRQHHPERETKPCSIGNYPKSS